MPDVLTSSSSAFRRRCRTGSTQLLRKTTYDSLFHNNTNDHDVRKTTNASKKFLRWTACFAFVTKFKRSKSEKLDFISEIDPKKRHSRSNSDTPAMVAQHNNDDDDKKTTTDTPYRHLRRPFSHYLERATAMDPDRDSIASTLLQWKDGGALPLSPLSALSPPPRHAMKERSRSLTVEDAIPVKPLPIPRKRKATTISRSLALRLSLDVDQHYSSSGITHSSSGFTSSDFLKKGELDDEDDTSSSISSSQPIPRNSLMQPSEHYQKLRLSSIETTTPPPSSPDLKKDQKQRYRVSPLVLPEIVTLKDEQQANHKKVEEDDDDSSDYGDLINKFRLPSEKLPDKVAMTTTATTTSTTCVVNDVQKNKEIVKEVLIHPMDCLKENNNNNSSPKPFVSRSTITARELSRRKTMETLEGHFGLEPTGSKSMDIVRDKAHYDAVVAGTLHRRPWTQYLRAQSESKEDKEQEERFHPQQTTIGQKERYIKASSAVFADYNSKLHRPSLVYPPSPNSINSDY